MKTSKKILETVLITNGCIWLIYAVLLVVRDILTKWGF